ncbi:MAG TPA: cytochrome c3 family protein [Vicinamibacterales bacterium]|nr:cytochrome c3 family protein [Vicinamibacterales bacterium]HPW20580.1 cytochrome c3 family protein [Vicinamibacterales bacterium]
MRYPFSSRAFLPLAAAACALIAAALAGMPAHAGSPERHAIDNADCYGCHGDSSLTMTGPSGETRSLYVDEQKHAASIHGQNRCTSCHADIVEVPHPEGFTPRPVACSNCHRLESEIYLASDHGRAVHKGVSEAASCKDCHGATHDLLNSRDPDSPVNRRNLPRTCGRCHADVAEMRKYNLRQSNPIVSYETSVHGIALLQKGALNSATCNDCHGSHDLHRSTNETSKLYWRTVPATCGKCHENVQRTYALSVHGKAVARGVRDAPVCTDCHGEHSIASASAPSSRVSAANVPGTCAQCHAATRIITQYGLPPDTMSSYTQSFHGLALQGGNPTAADCASCHGAHDILPSSDPQSKVNPARLPQTCGRCHPGIGNRLGAEFFRVHAPAGRHAENPWLVNLVTLLYIIVIVVTIGGMALFVTLDYVKKARDHTRAVNADPFAETRLTPWLRHQHTILMVLFIGLVYTGFVHRYPEAFFSWPFKAFSGGSEARALLHRIFGWSFTVLFVVHVAALLGTPGGRQYARALWFGRVDFKDAVGVVAYNLGLRQDRPPARRWNYAEKAEYWALVWGSAVMTITGIMLVFSEALVRMWPKIVQDLAKVFHFYEAVLATLAIAVWHAYWTVFDPHEYPMNPAWLIGKKAGHAARHAAGPPEAPALPGPETETATEPDAEPVVSSPE